MRLCIEGESRAVAGARYAILASRWNPRIIDALIDGAREALLGQHGVADGDVDVRARARRLGTAGGGRTRPRPPAAMPPWSRWAASCAATPATTSTSPTNARAA